MTNKREDEIDLFELFETLWDGKRLITFFMLTTTLASIAFALSVEEKYESNIEYSINKVPHSQTWKKMF